MEILYDVVNDDEERGMECLDGSFDSKKKALRVLAEQRKHFPTAYLLKSVVTRCREGAARRPDRLHPQHSIQTRRRTARETNTQRRTSK